MRFEDIAQDEIGVVLMHCNTKRRAVVIKRIGPPLNSITVQYLDRDYETIRGCKLAEFGKDTLRIGLQLREIKTGRQGMLLEGSAGPELVIQFFSTGRKIRRRCELIEEVWKEAFEIETNPAPKYTVPRGTL